VKRLWCELAWLGGDAPERGVLIEIDDGLLASVTPGTAEPPPDAERLRGLTLPGLANAHSHAFQRALRGRTHGGTGSFWTWREQMYALAGTVDPDSYLELARATFGEMALAGITLVGEFHYVHHDPQGEPYADPNAMGKAVVQAAHEAGIRITLLDACYLHGGIGRPLDDVQRRFADADAEAWAKRVDAIDHHHVGAVIHSVRAVDPESCATVAAWARDRGAPLHAHVSEQPAENDACMEAYGLTPTGVLQQVGALADDFTAVHATHLIEHDIAALGEAGATVCLCPTTERDLADGVGPARALRDAGVTLALGSDSHAVIDLFEEARAVELDERLVTGVRGSHRAADLLRSATYDGYACLGWNARDLADLIVVDLDSVRLAGTRTEDAVSAAVFAATASDVRDVMVDGEWIVRDRAHVRLDVAAELARTVGA